MPIDHGGVVQLVGKHDTARQPRAKRAQGHPVRHLAAREKQGGFGAMEFGRLPLQEHVIMVRAGDVAGAARAGATLLDCLVHRGQCLWMLAHAEVVVGAPDRHLTGPCPR
jgi:hypothetical protein